MFVCLLRFSKPPSQSWKIKRILNFSYFDILSIDVLADNYISKLHFIACQSSSFICQNILNLAKLLIYANWMTLHFPLVYCTIHFLILFHCIALENFDEFKRNDQTDGYESWIKDEIRSKGNSWYLWTVHIDSLCDHWFKGIIVKTLEITKYSTDCTA